MINHLKILFISVLIFTSCATCRIDKKFKEKYKNCISVVDKIQLQEYSTDIENSTYMDSFNARAHSLECLYAITGYEGFVDKNNEPHYFYPTYELAEQDIKYWKKWYKKNKCGFTLEKADSLIRHHAKEDLNPSLDWPISADSLVRYDF